MGGGRYSERYAYGRGRRHGAAAGDLLTGLVSYWKLDEATGASRADSVGSNTLTDPAVGDVAQVAGKIVSAAQFAGSAANILLVAAPSGLPTAALTVACWVNVDDGFSGASLARHGILAGTLAWQLLIAANAMPRFSVSADGLTYGTTVVGSAILDLTWVQLVAWHDPAAGELGVVVNGGAPTTTAHAAGLSGLAIGLDMGGNNSGSPFRVDELGIWSRVLTATERAQLYNSGAGLAFADF